MATTKKRTTVTFSTEISPKIEAEAKRLSLSESTYVNRHFKRYFAKKEARAVEQVQQSCQTGV